VQRRCTLDVFRCLNPADACAVSLSSCSFSLTKSVTKHFKSGFFFNPASSTHVECELTGMCLGLQVVMSVRLIVFQSNAPSYTLRHTCE